MVGPGMGRAPLVAAITAAFYVIVLYTVKTVPDGTVAMLGGPQRPIERLGGLTAWWKPPEGGEEAYQRYIAQRGSVVRRDGDLLQLEFPGLPEEAAKETIDMLAHGGLVMKEVVDGTSYAADIATRAGISTESHALDGPEDVALETDYWRPEDGGAAHTDNYLQAGSAAAMQRTIDAAFANGATLPEGTEIAFEWIEAYQDMRPRVRTYLVSTTVEIDGSMIASAMKSSEPYMNRPVVLLDFNRAGAEKFCELTRRMMGDKLATILGGRVVSAPIINGAICGGRASVSMGGTDARKQDAEAEALAGALRMGALPPGGTIERHQWKPAVDARLAEWLGRLLFGLVAGVIVGGLTMLVLRLTRPTARRRLDRISGGNKLGRRVLVTAIAPVALWLGAKITLPWVNDIELEHVTRGNAGAQFSVIAIGITPILFAYALVELAALAVPAWRWRRQDPIGRAGLGRAVALVTLLVAAIQAYFVWSYLDSMGSGPGGFGGFFGGGVEILDRGAHVKWLVIATLVAGTCILALVAGLITEHGLGNGYAALIASGFVIDVFDPYFIEGIDGFPHYLVDGLHPLLLGIVGAFAIALATRALLRRQVGELALPPSGVAPFGDSASVVALLLMLWSFVAKDPFQAQELMFNFYNNVPLHTTVVLASIPVWAWLFARPSIVVHVASRAGLEAPTYRTWLRATGFAFAAMAAMYAVGHTLSGAGINVFVPVSVMLATAAFLDIRDDMRARRRNLAVVGVVHHAQHAGVLERMLADARVPAHFHARNIRTLFAFFGPWAPIVVYAPEDAKEAARAKYEEWRQGLKAFD